jgi:microcystin-dependent protein
MADAIPTRVGNAPSPAKVLGQSHGSVVPDNTPFTAYLYDSAPPSTRLAGPSLGNSGGGQPHSNMMPSLALSFCIRVSGPFRSR